MNAGSEISEHEQQKKIKHREAAKKYYAKNSKDPLFKLRKSLINHKYKDKMKKLNAFNMIAENGGFTSRDGLLKKRREAEKYLPKDPVRAAQVVQELSKKYPMPCIATDEKKKKPASEAEKRVKEFYACEENVVILPGINDFVVRRDENNQKKKMQKHVLKDSMKNMYRKFMVSFILFSSSGRFS